MTYPANVIEILIASPCDVLKERQIVREVIAEWNVVHSRAQSVVLMPLGWETHTAPELNNRPQEIINERVLVHADILVGVFWTRIGSPTGKAISGSVEEIAEHRAKGKPVMVYFSEAPVQPRDVNQAQYEQLLEFRSWAEKEGLIESYSSIVDFKDKFRRQLSIAIQNDLLLRPLLQGVDNSTHEILLRLSGDAMDLLSTAARHKSALVVISRDFMDSKVTAGQQRFGEPGDRLSFAHWKALVRDLVECGYLVDRSGSGQVFHVTDAGYRAVGL